MPFAPESMTFRLLLLCGYQANSVAPLCLNFDSNISTHLVYKTLPEENKTNSLAERVVQP
ncbi:MAG: hypothetical protein K0S36_2366 [Nitrosospira multiformis]|jgi:hypothetical protein|nr:hypothetical protein [Nitrosospira multiformis]